MISHLDFTLPIKQETQKYLVKLKSNATLEWFWSHHAKGGFFQKVQFVFQISQSLKKNIQKNYPELEIQNFCQ